MCTNYECIYELKVNNLKEKSNWYVYYSFEPTTCEALSSCYM